MAMESRIDRRITSGVDDALEEQMVAEIVAREIRAIDDEIEARRAATEAMRIKLADRDKVLADQESRIAALEDRAARSAWAKSWEYRRLAMRLVFAGTVHSSLDVHDAERAAAVVLAGCSDAGVRDLARVIGARTETEAGILHAIRSRKAAVMDGVQRDFARMTMRMRELDGDVEVRAGAQAIRQLLDHGRLLDPRLSPALARQRLAELERRVAL